jgi:hypothetical protein
MPHSNVRTERHLRIEPALNSIDTHASGGTDAARPSAGPHPEIGMFFAVDITSHHNTGTPPAIPRVTRPITVAGSFGSNGLTPLTASVVLQFGSGGPSFTATVDLARGTFTCTGEPAASVRGTQTFVITAFASATYPHLAGTPAGTRPIGSAHASVTVRMADSGPGE